MDILKISFILILVKYERIKFLVIALKNAVEIYAWAPKPYHKFMAFKVCLCYFKKFSIIINALEYSYYAD